MKYVGRGRLRAGHTGDPAGVYGQPPVAVAEFLDGERDHWWTSDAGYPASLEDVEQQSREHGLRLSYYDGSSSCSYHLVLGQLWQCDPVDDEDPDLELLLLAAALDREAQERRRVDRARATVASYVTDGGGTTVPPSVVPIQRRAIPDDVKMFVWRRDEGTCTRCGTNRELEFDHIIPLAMGGSNTARNLQLLCGPCNRAKGGRLV